MLLNKVEQVGWDMSNFSVADVNSDVEMLMSSFSSGERLLPSSSHLFKISLVVPSFAFALSLIGDVLGYLSLASEQHSIVGYYQYILSDGWAVLLPTFVLGLFFAFMVYNNLLAYMAVPKDVREKSLILNHLKALVQRTITVFAFLMIVAALASIYVSWAVLAIPALMMVLFFSVNIIVSSEINRLGAGIALDKVSSLLKKI